MNTKQLIAGAAMALVGVAASAETPDVQFGFIAASQPSTVTRQQVGSELAQARKAAVDFITGAPVKAQPATQVTRLQVKAELVEARADDSFNASNGFGFIDNNYASTRTREEVRNEAIASARGKKTGF